MKKIILITALLSLLAFVLISCGHVHTFGEWTTVKEATCIEEGMKERICNCGEKETENIPVSEQHDWVSATCTTPKTCRICGKTTGSQRGHSVTKGTCSYCHQFIGNVKTVFDDMSDNANKISEYAANIRLAYTMYGTSMSLNVAELLLDYANKIKDCLSYMYDYLSQYPNDFRDLKKAVDDGLKDYNSFADQFNSSTTLVGQITAMRAFAGSYTLESELIRLVSKMHSDYIG